MYLRLGNTNLKYNSSRNDFIVFAEVIDSRMGYESPVLVRTTDELDIWFGKDFKERSYLQELLKMNITLYLTQPISNNSGTISDEEIDYSEFKVETFYNEDLFPEIGSFGTLYVVDNGISEKDYIWLEDSYVLTNNLPQNIGYKSSETLLNRDTLTICKKDSKVPYFHQIYEEEGRERRDTGIGKELVKYIKDSKANKTPADKGGISWLWGDVNLEKVDKGIETLAFTFTIPKFESTPGYVVLPSNNGTGKSSLIWYKERPKNIPTDILDNPNGREVKNYSEFLSAFSNSVNKYNIYQTEAGGVIWNLQSVPVTYFYSWEGFEMIPSPEINNSLIEYKAWEETEVEIIDKGENEVEVIDTGKLLSKPMIRLWSRTCGRPGETDNYFDNITFKLQYVGDLLWRATITRFDYEEIWEGYLVESNYRLDYIIEENSKLVHAEVLVHQPTLTENPEVPEEGEWQLMGSEWVEVSDSEKRINSLSSLENLFDEDSNIWPDFVLVPDLGMFIDPESEEKDAEEIYKRFLEIGGWYATQFLIQNTSENLRLNYTKDINNRLVWFFGTMTIGEQERPGYYIWLNGILQDKYSVEAKGILYTKPEIKDPYSETATDEEKLLKKYKSNYLVYNNQIYYYKEYQNGENFYTSILMRFIMGKITRELEKNKWLLIGEKIIGNVIENIQGKMRDIARRFSIVRSIEIENYEYDSIKQYLGLTISTTISDLAQNDMTIDITLNYNKN